MNVKTRNYKTVDDKLYNTWTEQIQNHQDDLDWVVGVLWHQPHLLEAGHGGVGLGLLLVVHSDSGHIVRAVNNNL